MLTIVSSQPSRSARRQQPSSSATPVESKNVTSRRSIEDVGDPAARGQRLQVVGDQRRGREIDGAGRRERHGVAVVADGDGEL